MRHGARHDGRDRQLRCGQCLNLGPGVPSCRMWEFYLAASERRCRIEGASRSALATCRRVSPAAGWQIAARSHLVVVKAVG